MDFVPSAVWAGAYSRVPGGAGWVIAGLAIFPAPLGRNGQHRKRHVIASFDPILLLLLLLLLLLRRRRLLLRRRGRRVLPDEYAVESVVFGSPGRNAGSQAA